MKWIEKLEIDSLKTNNCSFQELYNLLSNDSNKGTGLDKIIILFDYPKKFLRVIRRELYTSGFLLDREDTRRAKIGVTTAKNRECESEDKKLQRIQNYKATKNSWTEEMWESVYGENSSRNKNVSRRRKEYLDNNPDIKHQQIARFMNAPKYSKVKPNIPEQNIIKLETGLLYTGDGTYFTTLTREDGTFWHKNPDFILPKSFDSKTTRVDKVVEIMDFEFWHSIEEIPILEKLYLNKNIKCLILDAKNCYKEQDLKLVKNKIEEFIKS